MVVTFDPQKNGMNRNAASRTGRMHPTKSKFISESARAGNAGYNPTGTVGALADWASDAIVRRYVKRPGPLV